MESQPREEAICPRSPAESGAQLETLLMNTGSWSRSSSLPAPLFLASSHTPKQRPKAGKRQQGREVTCPSKPRVSTPTICCTDWKLDVQVRHLRRLPLLDPQESAANESWKCSVQIWGSWGFHPEPPGASVKFWRSVSLAGGVDGSWNRYMLPTWQVLDLPGLDPSRTCSLYSGLGARLREQNEREQERIE